MENELHRRDKVGVQDFVLLEDYTDTDAFLENLEKRFNENLIYTYIGSVLVSVNPYQELGVYGDEFIQTYRNVNFYELPPHIFAVADAAYRSMRGENHNQCVLISGESGAGKTEASKKILQYIAASSTHSNNVQQVKDRLLQSNPLLEAFGNAKTNRNDNSSRFGKYMDIQFDYKGAPIGGHILNYLLEKSRVVHQTNGERNFHIFYQVLMSGDEDLLGALGLLDRPEHFFYLNQGSCVEAYTVDDRKNFRAVMHALRVCDFSVAEQQALFSIVASVLHLGNLQFEEEQGLAAIYSQEPVAMIAKLLGCPVDVLLSAFLNRTIEAKGEKLTSPLNIEQALYARDALAKGIYDRLFTWIVKKINSSLAKREGPKCSLMGLLDIYGFEIFGTNSFEQFCINYCNEKLQQLFIELTLKSEQEEYQKEGIEWEPVQYFNNKIICDLVEAKPVGIIAIMDEECLRPGEPTDHTFLDKLSQTIGSHPHFVCHMAADAATRKTIQRDEFRLIHYAGDVTYNIQGFLDKNNDLLFRNLKEAMSQSSNIITCECFTEEELLSKKRPNTASSQFKSSLSQLMVILMSKEPSYVRCIKPNDYKRSHYFDEKIVLHQIKYLGLMENLRVRRAGFAYRRPYEVFLQRYKSLCPETWPHYHGSVRDGVHALITHLDYSDDDYKLGATKVFIRFPRVLFATEDAFQARKHDLATIIQAKYKCYHQREVYRRIRLSVVTIQCYWRRLVAKRLMEKRKRAAYTIRKFIKGFIMRNLATCEENKFFVGHTKRNYLYRLSEHLPKSVLDKSWLEPPRILQETSNLLVILCMKNMVLKYVKSVTPVQKKQLDQKVVASELFLHKKESYPYSVTETFQDGRLAVHHEAMKSSIFDVSVKQPDELVKYCTTVTKYDRHGYKSRKRVMILTDQNVYVLSEKDFTVKDKIPYHQITGVLCSGFTDGIFVILIKMVNNGSKTSINNNSSESKGDLILQSDYMIELVTKVAMIGGVADLVNVVNKGQISHDMLSGKQGTIEFTKGSTYSVKKGKNGQLCVICPAMI